MANAAAGRTFDATFRVQLGGKIDIRNRAPLRNWGALARAYTPGSASVATAIHRDPKEACRLIIKQDAAAVVTDGAAALGIGHVGPLAPWARRFKQLGAENVMACNRRGAIHRSRVELYRQSMCGGLSIDICVEVSIRGDAGDANGNWHLVRRATRSGRAGGRVFAVANLAAGLTNVADGLPQRQRQWATMALMLATAMATLDTAIANTALPTIADDLGVSAGASVWIINAYQLAMAAALLPLAAYGDIVGHRHVYIAGLVLFVVASFVCGAAWSLSSLIVGRVLQGLGAAGILGVTSALLRSIYPNQQLGRAMGIQALTVALFFAVGPTVASAILSVANWPWLFLANIPFGLLSLLLLLRTLPSISGARPSDSFDTVAALLVGGMFAFFILGVGEAAHNAHWARVMSEWVAALLCGAVLIYHEREHPAPLLALDLFQRRFFALSVVTSVFSYVAQGLAFVSLPFLFETVLGRSQVETGFLLTPWPAVVVIAAPIAGRLSERYSAALLGGGGLAVLSVGMALLALLPMQQPTVTAICWRLAICGAGFGFFQSPNLKALMASAPRERSGAASGIIPTARLLGQAMGTALVAACFTVEGESGAITALWLGSIFAGAGVVVSLLRVGKGQVADVSH
jgi:DHA2 family multidrug resistance protein-like MFS transporter